MSFDIVIGNDAQPATFDIVIGSTPSAPRSVGVYPAIVPHRRRPYQRHQSAFVPLNFPPAPTLAATLVEFTQRPLTARRRSHLRPSVFAPATVIADAVTPPFGAAGSATIVAADDGATITYSWPSVVRAMWSGTETRASLARTPRQKFDFSSMLTDAQLRELRATLAAIGADAPTFLLGLPHEELHVVSSTSSSITVQSLALCDWAVAGQRVVVIGRDGETKAATWISTSPIGATIPVGSDVSATAIEGARIMPAVAVKLEADIGFDHERVNLTRLSLTAWATQPGYGATTAFGTGATVTTHDGIPVWDRGNVTQRAQQPALTATQLIDQGLGVDAMALHADNPTGWGRSIRFESSDEAEWQWLKAFLMAVRGRSTAFLAPTGRPDLVPVGDASTGFLTISGSDYTGKWWPSLAHRRVHLVKADGTSAFRTVVASVDNGGGTHTLTLASALAGELERVELLETVRLDSDEAAIVCTSGSREASLDARVVQQ